MNKQLLMFQDQSQTNLYTNKIDTPVYEPRNKKPDIRELYNLTKVTELLKQIEDAPNVSADEKTFLRAAAYRHALFHYEHIADYYAHSSPEVQRLFEASALVIIDFESAIERGFVRVCENLRDQYMMEYNDDCFR